MKKALSVAIAACLLCFGVCAWAACGGSSTSSSSSSSSSTSSSSSSSSSSAASSTASAAAPEGNKLIVGFDQAYPPYGYKDTTTGEYTGVDLDLAKEVCTRNGWTFEAEPIDWDAKDALINQGNITCIWNGFTYEGRENDYAFSGLYMINGQVVVVKADSSINSLADLAGKTVITQVDSAAYELFEEDEANLAKTFAGGAVQTISDYNNAFMQLESGMVDAVACDLSIAAYQMSAKPNAYKQLSEQLSSEHYAVGFKKGNEALAETVTTTLKEMDAEGVVKNICDKYADQGISYENWCLK